MIRNEWRDLVNDKTVRLLNRWIEQYISTVIKPAYMPREAQRSVYFKTYNRHGIACFRVEVMEGIDAVRSTKPREFTDVDEFGYAFRELDFLEQIAILSYADPFLEFETRQEWRDYLTTFGIERDHGAFLRRSMVSLQKWAEKRGLVKPVEGEIRGWKSIASFMGRSIPTVMKMAKDPTLKMPVAMILGEAVTTEEKLRQFLNELIQKQPIWKDKRNAARKRTNSKNHC